MTLFRTECEGCGTVELVAEDITLILPAGADPATAEGRYRFVCPDGHETVRPAGARVVNLLWCSGANREIPVTVPFTVAEVEAFCDALKSESFNVWEWL